ncbi:hypothetical protein VPHD518_0079 [Vibrio phage D518]
MRFEYRFKSTDPFAHLPYPTGATGMVARVCGYEFAYDIYGHIYLLRRVVQSREYTAPNGEEMTGATYPFIDTYWRVNTRFEARMLWMFILTGREHYKNYFTIIHK